MTAGMNVWVGGCWYGPSYPDAGDLPSVPEVTPASGRGSSDGPPPKAGPGSSRSKWVDYAVGHGLVPGADQSRDDIIAALDKRGAPTE